MVSESEIPQQQTSNTAVQPNGEIPQQKNLNIIVDSKFAWSLVKRFGLDGLAHIPLGLTAEQIVIAKHLLFSVPAIPIPIPWNLPKPGQLATRAEQETIANYNHRWFNQTISKYSNWYCEHYPNGTNFQVASAPFAIVLNTALDTPDTNHILYGLNARQANRAAHFLLDHPTEEQPPSLVLCSSCNKIHEFIINRDNLAWLHKMQKNHASWFLRNYHLVQPINKKIYKNKVL